MKSILSLASVLLLGAQAVNVRQTTAEPDAKNTQEPMMEEEEELLLTTYIGFEFEGAELAQKFSALDNEEQNEVRLLVQQLILDYWTDAGSPSIDEDMMVDDEGAMDEDDEEAAAPADEEGAPKLHTSFRRCVYRHSFCLFFFAVLRSTLTWGLER